MRYLPISDTGGSGTLVDAGIFQLVWRAQTVRGESKAFRDYADYMATEEFSAGLNELLRIAKGSVPAIMCSEAVPWRCHRRLITDALIVAGAEVFDIMSASSTRRARLDTFARVQDGQITFPDQDGGCA